jgi:DNA primase
MPSPIEEIKQKLDIVEVISSYIKLDKCGANYRALCPFHSEKKPSFFVSPARQIWHCFGCGLGGGIFDFVMKIEGVEFGDALRILARRAGVELKKQDPRIRTERKRLYDICELAAKFFEKQLLSSKIGKEVKEYLLKRGITEESIKEWRIGYAPDTWRGLLTFLTEKGFRKEEVERAGLAVKNENGNFYDRFRGRIIFPIFDLNSQVVGFGGRVFGKKKEEETVAKYINIPNTLLYDKSKILYGLDKAKLAIRQADECILVEGYTDVIMSYQAGVKNVVAVSGTALTPFQLSVLKRYSENLATAFDMDIAGDSATKRGISLAQKQGFNIKVITLPENLDPADVISRHPEDWLDLVKSAKSILDFYFENAFLRFDKNTPEGKKEISKILIPAIKRIPNKIEASHWIGELAKRLGVPEKVIEEEIAKYKIEKEALEPTKEKEIEELKPKSRQERLEERILCLILKFPSLAEGIDLSLIDYFSEKSGKILEKIKKDGVKALEKSELEEEIKEYLNYLFLKAEVGEEIPQTEEEGKEEFLDSIKEIQRLEIKHRLDLISQQIKKAEEEKDSAEVEKLIKKFNQLSKELIELG